MSEPIRLIAGLGNPGPDYERTRHNAGFWLLDQIADDLRVSFTNEKSFFGHVAKARFEGEAILLVKPMTYMNRSGQSVERWRVSTSSLPSRSWWRTMNSTCCPGRPSSSRAAATPGTTA